MTAINAQTIETQLPGQSGISAYVSQAPSGTWLVQDEMDRRGGRFNDRKAALKFVRDEFGPNTDIVMRGHTEILAAA